MTDAEDGFCISCMGKISKLIGQKGCDVVKRGGALTEATPSDLNLH